MEPWHFLLLGAAAAVLAFGFTRKKPRVLLFDDASLARVKSLVTSQGFTVESFDHVPGGAIRAVGVRLDDRVVGSVAVNGASIVVHGLKTPPRAYRATRAKIEGAEVTDDVKTAIDALFANPHVKEMRVLALGDQGGAVRVELDGAHDMTAIAAGARAVASASGLL